MTPVRNLTAFLLVAATLVASPRAARADAATEAQLQFELGSELYKQGRYPEAIERFIASYRQVPNSNVVLNVVQTFIFLKRFEDAYNWNETFLSIAATDAQRQAGNSRRGDLGKRVAVLDVTTTPADAELFIDRAELGSVGRAPRRVAVKAGDHRVIARAKDFDERTVSVSVKTAESKPVQIELPPLLGTVRIRSVPPGAIVRDDATGAELGKTPAELRLRPAAQRLVVELAGWVSQTRTVNVLRDRTSQLEVVLQRAATTVAVLSVLGNVPGASIVVDGRLLGRAPLSLDTLPPGQVLVAVNAPGRDAWQERVTLERGAATRVDFDLADPSTKTWSGWRWLGYGGGAALVTAGALVGLSALSARGEFDQRPSSEALDRVKTRNTTADILLGSGVVVLGGTLTWDLLRAPDPKSGGAVTMDR